MEGDIALSGANEEMQKRNGRRLRQYLWPGKIVPYEIEDTLSKMSLILVLLSYQFLRHHFITFYIRPLMWYPCCLQEVKKT